MAANDLTTIAAVKAYPGFNAADGDPASTLLARLVTAASAAIQRYTNRDIIQATYNEVRDGYGGTKMLLRQFPAQAPTLVQVDGITIAQRASPTAAGWVFDGNRVLGLSGYVFTRGISNVVVAYTAGWPLGSVPADIEQACIELVVQFFRNRTRIGDQSLTVAAGSGHETVAYLMRSMTPTTKAMLDQFRDVCPC